MFRFLRRHLSYANIVATMALAFAMGGTAIAAHHYLITSARQIKPSVLKALKTPGPKGATGAAGAPGAPGAPGAAGKDGALAVSLFARVNLSAGLESGRGVTSVVKAAKGQYEVEFNRSISSCAYEVTVGAAQVSPENETIEAPAQFADANVEPILHKPDGVFIIVLKLNGELEDHGFFLTVTC